MNEHVDIDRLLAEEAEAAEAQPHVSGTPVRNTEPVKAPSQVYSLRIPVDALKSCEASLRLRTSRLPR